MRADLTSPTASQRFQREALAWAQVVHPAVVQVLDSGVAELKSGTHVSYLVLELVKGETLDEFNKRTGSVVEGAATVKAAVELADELKVEVPIARGVHAVLYEGIDPREAIRRLMARELKEERVG